MTLKLLYFARLRERLGTIGETLKLPDSAQDVAGLLKLLRKRGGNWESELTGRPVLVAVNQNMVSPQHLLQAGDEVALFPPVTGG
ncbi:MAG: molybdopterin converting factor subunit 1 [Gallionella sp.]